MSSTKNKKTKKANADSTTKSGEAAIAKAETAKPSKKKGGPAELSTSTTAKPSQPTEPLPAELPQATEPATSPESPSESSDPRTVIFSMKGTSQWAEWFDGLVEFVAKQSEFIESRTEVAEEAFRLYAHTMGFRPPPERMFRRKKRAKRGTPEAGE